MAKHWSREEQARLGRSKRNVERLGQRDEDAARSAADKMDRDKRGTDRTEPASRDSRGSRAPLDHRTVEELYLLARQKSIPGRSRMNKAELIEALSGEGSR